MSKNISKKEIREFYKHKAGIILADNDKKACINCCFFNSTSKYCGEHKIRTQKNEVCTKFKKQRSYKVYAGGLASPK